MKEYMAGSYGKKEIIKVSISSDMLIRDMNFKRHYSYTYLWKTLVGMMEKMETNF